MRHALDRERPGIIRGAVSVYRIRWPGFAQTGGRTYRATTTYTPPRFDMHAPTTCAVAGYRGRPTTDPHHDHPWCVHRWWADTPDRCDVDPRDATIPVDAWFGVSLLVDTHGTRWTERGYTVTLDRRRVTARYEDIVPALVALGWPEEHAERAAVRVSCGDWYTSGCYAVTW